MRRRRTETTAQQIAPKVHKSNGILKNGLAKEPDYSDQLTPSASSGGRRIPEEVGRAFAESDKYFPTDLQKFQFFDKYSRFDYELGRRETWIETVDRAANFLRELSQNKLPESVYQRIRQFVLEMKAAPSMRLLAMAGPAARRNNICIYNCSYMPVDSIDAWVEALIISMSGCGVGFSVEKKYVSKLPPVKPQVYQARPVHIIGDSTEEWAEAVRTGFNAYFNGEDIVFDYSQLRPAGAPLKVKGGRASGPEPLRQALEFARAVILGAQGRQLTTVEAHDIMCKVGDAAVSGGMRRTAMISLFDWDDVEMRLCKQGEFWKENPQRWNANNSAVWPSDITDTDIMQQMIDMFKGENGEPGVFNRDAAIRLRPARRAPAEFGTNPCGEISLRPYEFCNLSIAIARSEDTPETLAEKVEVASIIGTIQSLATYFPGLRETWKHNCEEERLLGVDITGQLDCPAVQDPTVMNRLKQVAVETNQLYAQILGIRQSASVTCVKPSGNSSQLFNCSSGLHARWAPFYIRNVRVSAHSPIFKVLKECGVPMDPENGQTAESANTWVVHFPVKSPKGAVTRNNRSALEQCEYWKMNKLHWTEHNPSVTITYKPEEKVDLMKWVIENKDYVGGMSFLPAFDAKYDQLPYIEIGEEEYNRHAFLFPPIDFSKLYLYEHEDLTTTAQELACVAGACEVDYDPNALYANATTA